VGRLLGVLGWGVFGVFSFSGVVFVVRYCKWVVLFLFVSLLFGLIVFSFWFVVLLLFFFVSLFCVFCILLFLIFFLFFF
jgi:hypothetical protein